MTTEERLEKVERELTETKSLATREKRHNRWLAVAIALPLAGLACGLAKEVHITRTQATDLESRVSTLESKVSDLELKVTRIANQR